MDTGRRIRRSPPPTAGEKPAGGEGNRRIRPGKRSPSVSPPLYCSKGKVKTKAREVFPPRGLGLSNAFLSEFLKGKGRIERCLTHSPYSAAVPPHHPFPEFKQPLIQRRAGLPCRRRRRLGDHLTSAVAAAPLHSFTDVRPLAAGHGPAPAAGRQLPVPVPRRAAGGGAPALPPRRGHASLRVPSAARRPPRTGLLPPPLAPCPAK